MHQSCMLSTQSNQRGSSSFGWTATRPSRTASPAAFGQRPDLDEPLQATAAARSARRTARSARRCARTGRFSATIRPCRRQRLAHRDPGLEAVHAVELGAGVGDPPGLVHDRRHRQVVPAADLEVVRVVRRGDLDRAGAELGSTCSSATTGIMRPDQRQLDLAADQVRVALVVGVHGDRGVAEHRLDPGGGHDDGVVAVAVADGDQLALDVVVLDLDVGQHAAHRRATS